MEKYNFTSFDYMSDELYTFLGSAKSTSLLRNYDCTHGTLPLLMRNEIFHTILSYTKSMGLYQGVIIKTDDKLKTILDTKFKNLEKVSYF